LVYVFSSTSQHIPSPRQKRAFCSRKVDTGIFFTVQGMKGKLRYASLMKEVQLVDSQWAVHLLSCCFIAKKSIDCTVLYR